jgi:hypothetical protein
MITPPDLRPEPIIPPEVVAASLLTSAAGAEVQIVAGDGSRLRLATDEEIARSLIVSLWRALDRPG